MKNRLVKSQLITIFSSVHCQLIILPCSKLAYARSQLVQYFSSLIPTEIHSKIPVAPISFLMDLKTQKNKDSHLFLVVFCCLPNMYQYRITGIETSHRQLMQETKCPQQSMFKKKKKMSTVPIYAGFKWLAQSQNSSHLHTPTLHKDAA